MLDPFWIRYRRALDAKKERGNKGASNFGPRSRHYVNPKQVHMHDNVSCMRLYLIILTRKRVFGYLSLECFKGRINYQWLDLLSLGNAVMKTLTHLQHLISLLKKKKVEFISSFTIPYLCSKDLIKNCHRSVDVQMSILYLSVFPLGLNSNRVVRTLITIIEYYYGIYMYISHEIE